MLLKIAVDGAYCKIIKNIPSEDYKKLALKLSYLPDDYQWRDSYSKFGGDGRVRLISRGKFPTGLLPYVEEFCSENDYTLEITETPKKNNFELLEMSAPDYKLSPEFVLRDYQEEAIQAAIAKKRGMIQCPTGSGKSLIAARMIERFDKYPALVCLTSKDLLEQTVKAYEEYLGCEIGKVVGGKFDLKPITIAMVQSLNSAVSNKNPEIIKYLRSVKCLVVDECHHQVAKTVQNVAYNCLNAELRVGASGTCSRDNADDMEIEAALGPVVYKLSVSELIKRDKLVKPTIYMFTLPTRYETKKPYPQYSDIIADYIEGNSDRNKIIAELTNHLLDGNDRNCVILCNRISHGKTLESLLPGSRFVSGEDSVEDRSEIFADFKKKRLRILIATSIIDEGWDCPNLDSLILAHPYKSVVKCFQRIGRALRKYEGKEEAIIVDFYDKVKYLDHHANKRINMYKSEPEFDLIFKELT